MREYIIDVEERLNKLADRVMSDPVIRRSVTSRPDRSKPRNKRDYTQQRKLKEKFLVFSS